MQILHLLCEAEMNQPEMVLYISTHHQGWQAYHDMMIWVWGIVNIHQNDTFQLASLSLPQQAT